MRRTNEFRDHDLGIKFLAATIKDTKRGTLLWEKHNAKEFFRNVSKSIDGGYPLYKMNDKKDGEYISSFFENDELMVQPVIYKAISALIAHLYIIELEDKHGYKYYEMYSMTFEVKKTKKSNGEYKNVCKKCVPLLHTKGEQLLYKTLVNTLIEQAELQINGQMKSETMAFMESYLKNSMLLTLE